MTRIVYDACNTPEDAMYTYESQYDCESLDSLREWKGPFKHIYKITIIVEEIE